MRTAAALRRLERRGVDAIFTTPARRRDARFLIGLVGIVTGVALWVAVAIQSEYPYLFGTPEIRFYVSILLNSVGLILVISGTAVCLSLSISDPTNRQNRAHGNGSSASDPATIDRADPLPEIGEGGGDRQVLLTRSLKLGVIAFLQCCIILALFSGLADEYQSNNNMQLWVRLNFPIGQFLLSWWTSLIIASVLGVILVQFLPGRLLAE